MSSTSGAAGSSSGIEEDSSFSNDDDEEEYRRTVVPHRCHGAKEETLDCIIVLVVDLVVEDPFMNSISGESADGDDELDRAQLLGRFEAPPNSLQ